MSDSSARSLVGSKLGPYQLTSILGQGGMGTVFQGEDTFTGRKVAIKLLHASFAQDPGVAQRFIREARAAVSLRHPNVVEVLHMNQDEHGVVYMVLELLEGCSLDAHLRKNGPVPLNEAVRYLAPIMSALEVAHEKGIVHRDVKPENIFLSETAAGIVPKLLDFGIAKMADAVTGFSTNAGSVMGSPAYMSPEQAMGSNKIGPPTDVWAMGVVFYECLTGSSPFAAGDARKCLAKVLTADPPALRDLVKEILQEPAELIESTLTKESPERPTMQTLRLGLSPFLSVPPPVQEAATTRISGVDYTSHPSALVDEFPESPSDVGLAPTGILLVTDPVGSTQNGEQGVPPQEGEEAAEPQIATLAAADDTFMPASSGPRQRNLSQKKRLIAVAVAAIGASLGFFVVSQIGNSRPSSAPDENLVIAHEVELPPSPEPESALGSELDPNTDPQHRSEIAAAPDPRDSELVATTQPQSASETDDSVPQKSQPEPVKAPTRAKPPAPAPSAEELLKKRREERIGKIPAISEL